MIYKKIVVSTFGKLDNSCSTIAPTYVIGSKLISYNKSFCKSKYAAQQKLPLDHFKWLSTRYAHSVNLCYPVEFKERGHRDCIRFVLEEALFSYLFEIIMLTRAFI